MTEQPETIRISYLKSSGFRQLHVDGIIGGLTPHGLMHIATFCERPAIPNVTVHKVINSMLGPIDTTEGREGTVREIDADLFMTLNTARSLHQWLGEKLTEADAVLTELEAKNV